MFYYLVFSRFSRLPVFVSSSQAELLRFLSERYRSLDRFCVYKCETLSFSRHYMVSMLVQFELNIGGRSWLTSIDPDSILRK